MSMPFITTMQDQQISADIRVFQGERPLTKDCVELGRFDMSGITPAPRGVPKIEIAFEIDEDGIVKVKAREKIPTAKPESLTIKDYKGNLTQREIERMIKEAKKMVEEDKIAKARVDARNELERYIYNVKNGVSRITKEDNKQLVQGKGKVENAVREVSRWYDENPYASQGDHEKKLKKLRDVWNSIRTMLKGNDA